LEQGIQLAQPNSIHGLVNYVETQPQTVGTYPGGPALWFEQNVRFLWIKPSTGEAFAYKAGVGFQNVATKIPINTITTAMLQDHSVTPPKLWAPNDAAQKGFTFVLDSGGANWLIADVIAARPDKSIQIAKLQPSTTDLDFIRTIGGNTVWAPLTAANLNTILAQVGGGLLNTNAIDVSPWAPLTIARVNAAGTFLEFVAPFDLLADKSIPIIKLSPGVGNANKYIGVNAAGDTVVYITPPVPPTTGIVTKGNSGLQTVPPVGDDFVWTHGLAVPPTSWVAEFVCFVANNNYDVGDAINIDSVTAGGSNIEINAFSARATPTTTISVVQLLSGSATQRSFLHATSGALVSWVESQWKLRISYVNVS
jgi:hypothetical protein